MDYQDEERADYQQQEMERLRMYDESVARYRAAHPLWDKCRNHPERQSVGPHCYTTQLCAQCIEDQAAMYVDHRPDKILGPEYDNRYYTDHPDYRHYNTDHRGSK